jgi:serine/threonine protein kinase
VVPLFDFGIMILQNYKGSQASSSSNKELKPEEEAILAGFYVMPKYDINLRDFLKLSEKVDTDMIFDMGCQLLDAFEALHEAGYVYNDLKPENIMINIEQSNSK